MQITRFASGLRFDNLRGDLFGGVTAAIIALPLALAFGVASGAGPMAGLYGAIFVGFFASMFGGTATQVSGPTGPMTVVMATVITQYAHEPAMAFTVVMMGGLFQILFGVLRLGSLINLVPFTVVSGFMSGIGVIIIILQLGPLIGHAAPQGSIIETVMALPGFYADPNWHALAVGGLTLAMVYLMPTRLSRFLPPPLLALAVGSVLVLTLLPNAPVLGEIPTGAPKPHLPTLQWAAFPQMVGSALVLALLGSIDTLLTSLIADSMTRTLHKPNRELIAQGLGNAVAGLFGGIPGAGATMRTVVNIRSGGKTGLSGVTHSLLLLAIILGLAPLASNIPHAVLAGILIKVGIDIIDWRYVTHIRYAPRPGIAIMFLVFGLTVFVDLILAVGVGMVAASLLFVKRMADLQIVNTHARNASLEALLHDEEAKILSRHADKIILYHLSGPVSFGGGKGMMQGLALGGGHKVVVVDFSDVTLIDTSGAFAVEDLLHRAHAGNQHVLIAGLKPQGRKVMGGLGILKPVPREHVFNTRLEAIQYAAGMVISGEVEKPAA
jgi:SulP family sulfate permease